MTNILLALILWTLLAKCICDKITDKEGDFRGVIEAFLYLLVCLPMFIAYFISVLVYKKK